MTANFGQKFEKDFKASVPEHMMLIRLKTRMSAYKGDNEMADFIVFSSPSLYVLELKSTQEKRLPFDMIRANQIIGIQKSVEKYGVYGGILVQFREPSYSHFYVPITVLVEYIDAGKKSIPIADMHSDNRIIEVPFTQKRVSCKLDIETLLQRIKEVSQ